MEIVIRTDDLLTVAEAAARLGMPKITLYKRLEKGRIASVTLGGKKLIPTSEVERIKGAERLREAKT